MEAIWCWLSELTPDGVLTAGVLLLQLVLIWRTYRLARDAEERSREHDRLSVRPYLEFHFERGPNGFRLEVLNHGLGVTIISGVDIWIDKKQWVQPPAVAQTVDSLLSAFGLTQEVLRTGVESHVNALSPPVGLKAGGSLKLISLQLRPTVDAMALGSRLAMKISFTSIYEEKLRFANLGDVPSPA